MGKDLDSMQHMVSQNFAQCWPRILRELGFAVEARPETYQRLATPVQIGRVSRGRAEVHILVGPPDDPEWVAEFFAAHPPGAPPREYGVNTRYPLSIIFRRGGRQPDNPNLLLAREIEKVILDHELD